MWVIPLFQEPEAAALLAEDDPVQLRVALAIARVELNRVQASLVATPEPRPSPTAATTTAVVSVGAADHDPATARSEDRDLLERLQRKHTREIQLHRALTRVAASEQLLRQTLEALASALPASVLATVSAASTSTTTVNPTTTAKAAKGMAAMGASNQAVGGARGGRSWKSSTVGRLLTAALRVRSNPDHDEEEEDVEAVFDDDNVDGDEVAMRASGRASGRATAAANWDSWARDDGFNNDDEAVVTRSSRRTRPKTTAVATAGVQTDAPALPTMLPSEWSADDVQWRMTAVADHTALTLLREEHDRLVAEVHVQRQLLTRLGFPAAVAELAPAGRQRHAREAAAVIRQAQQSAHAPPAPAIAPTTTHTSDKSHEKFVTFGPLRSAVPAWQLLLHDVTDMTAERDAALAQCSRLLASHRMTLDLHQHTSTQLDAARSECVRLEEHVRRMTRSLRRAPPLGGAEGGADGGRRKFGPPPSLDDSMFSDDDDDIDDDDDGGGGGGGEVNVHELEDDQHDDGDVDEGGDYDVDDDESGDENHTLTSTVAGQAEISATPAANRPPRAAPPARDRVHNHWRRRLQALRTHYEAQLTETRAFFTSLSTTTSRGDDASSAAALAVVDLRGALLDMHARYLHVQTRERDHHVTVAEATAAVRRQARAVAKFRARAATAAAARAEVAQALATCQAGTPHLPSFFFLHVEKSKFAELFLYF